MTPQQPSPFHTALNGLFEGNGQPLPFVWNVLRVPSYSWAGGAISR